MSHYDLYAIGNALVDSEFEVSDSLLKSMGVDKRHMTLIDTPRRAELLSHVKHITPRQTGGGSAGNTVVALSQLGGKAFYSCKVAHDDLGDFYVKDLQARGVDTNLTHTRASNGQTGSCMVLVTPDAERSMCTFLGVSAELDDDALHSHDIAKSKIYYMEGYLAASPTGLNAALKGRQIAKEKGVKKAILLPVSGAFHSILMKEAQEKMQIALQNISIHKPIVPIIANVSANVVEDHFEIKNLLTQQITGSVRWRETILCLEKNNIEQIIEIGAGKVLANMATRTCPSIKASSIQNIDDLKNYINII